MGRPVEPETSPIRWSGSLSIGRFRGLTVGTREWSPSQALVHGGWLTARDRTVEHFSLNLDDGDADHGWFLQAVRHCLTLEMILQGRGEY